LFIYARATLQLNLEGMKGQANYRIKLPNDSIIECPILYKQIPITIGGTIFLGDLIQFNLLNIDIILGMNLLHHYRAKIDCKDLRFTLKYKKGREVRYYRQREETPHSTISTKKVK